MLETLGLITVCRGECMETSRKDERKKVNEEGEKRRNRKRVGGRNQQALERKRLRKA